MINQKLLPDEVAHLAGIGGVLGPPEREDGGDSVKEVPDMVEMLEFLFREGRRVERVAAPLAVRRVPVDNIADGYPLVFPETEHAGFLFLFHGM